MEEKTNGKLGKGAFANCTSVLWLVASWGWLELQPAGSTDYSTHPEPSWQAATKEWLQHKKKEGNRALAVSCPHQRVALRAYFWPCQEYTKSRPKARKSI